MTNPDTEEAHPMLVRVARSIAEPIVRAGLKRDWTLSLSPDPEAIAQRLIDREWPRHLGTARAALSALRDLTPDVVEVFYDAGSDLTGNQQMAEQCWTAMINHILGESA